MRRFKLHLNLASLAPPLVCCLLSPVVFSLTISSQSALSAITDEKERAKLTRNSSPVLSNSVENTCLHVHVNHSRNII